MKKFYPILILLALIAFPYPAKNQTKQATKDFNPTVDQELVNAQKENQKAQTDYYREQTKRLQEPSPTPSPSPSPKSFTQSIKENPAGVLGVVAAVIAALVALISFIFNFSASLQNQRDTQFYEALKRFGDKDSPTIRGSAAGLLAEIGKRSRVIRVRNKPYLKTALDQLVTGLLLENNKVVLVSIENALKKLITENRSYAADKLSEANKHLQEELVRALAEYFIAHEVEDPYKINDALWSKIASLIGFEQAALSSLIGIEELNFPKYFEKGVLTPAAVSPLDSQNRQTPLFEIKKRRQMAEAAKESLELTATRLHINIEICIEVLSDFIKPFSFLLKEYDPAHPKLRTILKFSLSPRNWRLMFKFAILEAKLRRRMKKIDPKYLLQKSKTYDIMDKLFLADAKLEFAQISGVFLRKAQLQGANFKESELIGVDLSEALVDKADFSSANLRFVWFNQASLRGANFRGAVLDKVEMKEASIWGIEIDDETILKNTKWWEANFFDEDGASLNMPLLETFHLRFSSSLQPNPSEFHPSVKRFHEITRESMTV